MLKKGISLSSWVKSGSLPIHPWVFVFPPPTRLCRLPSAISSSHPHSTIPLGGLCIPLIDLHGLWPFIRAGNGPPYPRAPVLSANPLPPPLPSPRPSPPGRAATLSVECKVQTSSVRREKRHRRVRGKVVGTEERPRLAVFRSNEHIYCQVINDASATTLAAASSLQLKLENGATVAAAQVSIVESSQRWGMRKGRRGVFSGHGFSRAHLPRLPRVEETQIYRI